MKTELRRNIELVQINIVAGEQEYYLPKNVAWNGEVLQQLVVCTPETACYSPIDGITPVMQRSEINDVYFQLYDIDGNEIVHDLHCDQLLHTNNNPVRIDKVLNLSLSRIRFAQAPVADRVLLLYAIYGSDWTENFEQPKQSVTVHFPLGAGKEISFRELINLYIHALPNRVKSITFHDAINNPAFLLMRDHALSYSISNMHCEMARPQIVAGATTAEDVQVHTLYVDDLDIDFDYSRIYNPTASDNVQNITFEY